MAHEVKIPAAGESINSATIGQWHKADGETIVKGDLLATIETDKVSTELESEVTGTIRIVVPEGEEVAIGTIIAEIAEGAEMSSADAPVASESAEGEEPEPERQLEVAAGPAAAGDAEVPFGFTTLDDEPEIIAIKVPAAGESIASATIAQWHKRDGEGVREGETLVTLETDKVSAELDAEADGVLSILSPEGMEVSIGAVIGTLTVGAVPAAEVAASAPEAQEAELAITPDTVSPAPIEAALPVMPSDPASSAAAELRSTSLVGEEASSRLKPDFNVIPEPPRREEFEPFSDGRITRRRLSSLRRKIAAQLVNAQQTAAILTTFNEVDMSAVIELRKTVQESFMEKYGTKLGFMSLFVKAVVHALQEVPSLNGRIDGDEIIENHFYDIGIAVGTEKGLVVPVVRDADKKGCPEIEKDILSYSERAREGKIQLEDLQGGVFTVSNGGIYGSLLSTPILNPPQSGILGMHTIQERPVAIDGKVEVRPMMYLALSYDHRLVDGKEAVTFLIRIKDCLESPASLLLEL